MSFTTRHAIATAVRRNGPLSKVIFDGAVIAPEHGNSSRTFEPLCRWLSIHNARLTAENAKYDG